MTNFKSYWDLSEKERAELTHEAVTRFEAIELMTAGVLPVEPLVLDPEPETDEPPTVTHYRVRSGHTYLDCAFASMEEAKAFVALKPLRVASSYLNGDWNQTVHYTAPLEGVEIVAVELTTQSLFEIEKDGLEKRAAARKENRERMEQHDKAVKKRNEALAGMWSDWHRCRHLDADHRKVVATFAQYVQIAGGDRTVAARFLLKAFTSHEILDAALWCVVQIDLPIDEPEPARPRSEPTNDAVGF